MFETDGYSVLINAILKNHDDGSPRYDNNSTWVSTVYYLTVIFKELNMTHFMSHTLFCQFRGTGITTISSSVYPIRGHAAQPICKSPL